MVRNVQETVLSAANQSALFFRAAVRSPARATDVGNPFRNASIRSIAWMTGSAMPVCVIGRSKSERCSD